MTAVPRWRDWDDADVPNPESDTYPPERLKPKQSMARREKLPYAPWTDPDAPAECSNSTCVDHNEDTPERVIENCDACQRHRDDETLTCAECGHSARYKWNYTGNYRDGETVAMVEADEKIDGRVFIQREDDDWAFVDGDDVRCPETGDPHPAFVAILEHLGLTYADVSTSGTGVHAQYRGEWPFDGTGEASFAIDDEPWGSNDDPPTVEIYANKHVCVDTGKHVPGTPLEIAEWDEDALRAILEANGEGESEGGRPAVSHDTDRERPDLEDYEPAATGGDETTSDIRDVFAAIDKLTPRDLRLQRHRAGTDPTGWETWNPFYRPSSSNESLHRPPGGDVFHDFDGGGSFGLLRLFAADQGIVTDARDPWRGDEWWQAVEAARDLGAEIPEYDPSDAEHTAVLPDSPATRAATNGWDWTRDTSGETLTQEDAWDRTTDAITGAIERCDDVLIEALPTMGKSYSAVKSAAESGEPVTIATGRGRKEQYAQYREWADDHALEHYTLPAFTHDCPTANGDHGDEWGDTVARWYNAGATPRDIHAFAESELGRPLPCQEHGECPYSAKWRFEPDDYDVLIGHYKHLHNEKATSGRSVLVDEFPGGAFETTLSGDQLARAVSTFLAGRPGLPFDNWTDLVENRADDQRRADALVWFEDQGIEADGLEAFADDGHAAAPLAAYTLLVSDDLGNDWERAQIGDAAERRIGLFNRAESAVSVLNPPALDYARNVVGLDGTPTPEMWRVALGRRKFNHRPVLQDEERAEYLRDALGLRLVPTTNSVKSYSASEDEIPNRVTVDEDTALLEAVGEKHGQRPDLITTARAEKHYDDEGVLEEHVSRTKHYGNVLGSNEFGDSRLGAVIGSRNFGPNYVKKWGAYLDETVEPRFPGVDFQLETGVRTDYGEVGNRIRKHMTEHETLQAAMRFGRDGNGAVVYVHTDTLPDWVPTAGEGRVIKTWSDGMRQVIDAARDLGEWTTAELADHPAVEISERQVRTHLWRLVNRGVLSVESEGCGYVWQDDGLHRVNDHGDVELEAVDADDLDEDERAEVARMNHYRWDFRRSRAESRSRRSESGSGPSAPAESAEVTGDPPPNPGD